MISYKSMHIYIILHVYLQIRITMADLPNKWDLLKSRKTRWSRRKIFLDNYPSAVSAQALMVEKVVL